MKRQFFFSEIERSVWEVVLVWKVTKTKTRWATHRPRWSEVRARSSGNTACFVWLSVFFLYIYIIWGADYELVGGLSFAPHSSSDCIPIGTLHRAEPSVGGYCLECVRALQGFDLPTHRVHLSHSSPDKDQRPRLVCSPARRPDW